MEWEPGKGSPQPLRDMDIPLINLVSSILAKANGRSQIDVQDVTECEELFLDARRSAALLSGEAGKGYLS